jgi:UDP-N-acetylmuramoyl-L-alanyl-D-glutamate--2,6-diaminopimelate ligase
MINLTCANVIRYGRKDCDVKLKDINFKGGVSKFSVKLGDRDILIKSHLVGMHNAYNILAAVACAFNLGINTRKIQQGIWKLKCVPGRLEPVNVGQSYKIFVDYAHTDDGLKNVLTALNGLYDKNKIISVFGCGGDRDRGKRPKMGHVASSLSDYVIITSDNPRTESAEDIAHQIVSGIKRDNFEVTLERRAAIRKALLLADNNTVILIAGKGHEQYQILGNKRIHFDDRRVSEELIESLG